MTKPAKPAKNHKHALAQVRSWLRAVNIPFMCAEDGVDLLVEGRNSEVVAVSITESGEVVSNDSYVTVPADQILHKNVDIALASFFSITSAAGYGNVRPIDRGPEPNTKLMLKEDPELVAMRHTEFRRAPDPKPAMFKQYHALMAKACWRFIRMNPDLCARHGVEHDDLMTYARVFLVNFLGHFEVPNPTNNDNERLFTNYMHQRFAEVFKMTQKKERSCIPDAETAQIALVGQIVDTPRFLLNKSASKSDESNLSSVDIADPRNYLFEEKIDTDFINRHNELGEFKSDFIRRRRATAVLEKHLASMPHDQMVEALVEAKQNENFSFDARREARLRLDDHVKVCATCAQAAELSPVTGLEEDEEVAGVDADCALE